MKTLNSMIGRALIYPTPAMLLLKWFGLIEASYLIVFIGWLILIAYLIISTIIGTIAYHIKK